MTIELKNNLINEYQEYLSSVASGDLEDFCPYWALDHFMVDRFGENYMENKEAIAFYNDHGCAVRIMLFPHCVIVFILLQKILMKK